LFVPGQGAAGQIHDFNPGILPNGLFWTMSIPRNSLTVSHQGEHAQLRLRHLPIPDTFFYANNVSVAAEIDVDLSWSAIAAPVPRGFGSDWAAFAGEFADASCEGTAAGRETGFAFQSGRMDASAFFAELGFEKNGVFFI
jgi:hypothetical protein